MMIKRAGHKGWVRNIIATPFNDFSCRHTQNGVCKMNNNIIPEKLYKFKSFESFDDHYKDSYMQNKIFLSEFYKLNDPME